MISNVFRRGLCLLSVLVVSAGLAVSASSASAEAPVAAASARLPVQNNSPAFLQVYSDNVENLPTAGSTCPGDWKDLLYYMRQQYFLPDVFLVQQVSDQAQLDYLIGQMHATLGGNFAGIIAVANPQDTVPTCAPSKAHQTNAIIYRTDRLLLMPSTQRTWRSAVGSDCHPNNQTRTININAQFYDWWSAKFVTAESIHWPTTNAGTPCSAGNAYASIVQGGNPSDSLRIVGGDTNARDYEAAPGVGRPNDWYQLMNGDIGGAGKLRDVVYISCVATGHPMSTCLSNNWTHNYDGPGVARLDFLFAKHGDNTLPGVGDAKVISFAAAGAADAAVTGADNPDLNYSDHRATASQIYY